MAFEADLESIARGLGTQHERVNPDFGETLIYGTQTSPPYVPVYEVEDASALYDPRLATRDILRRFAEYRPQLFRLVSWLYNGTTRFIVLVEERQLARLCEHMSDYKDYLIGCLEEVR